MAEPRQVLADPVVSENHKAISALPTRDQMVAEFGEAAIKGDPEGKWSVSVTGRDACLLHEMYGDFHKHEARAVGHIGREERTPEPRGADRWGRRRTRFRYVNGEMVEDKPR